MAFQLTIMLQERSIIWTIYVCAYLYIRSWINSYGSWAVIRLTFRWLLELNQVSWIRETSGMRQIRVRLFPKALSATYSYFVRNVEREKWGAVPLHLSFLLCPSSAFINPGHNGRWSSGRGQWVTFCIPPEGRLHPLAWHLLLQLDGRVNARLFIHQQSPGFQNHSQIRLQLTHSLCACVCLLGISHPAAAVHVFVN